MSTITTGSKAHRHLYVDNYYTRHVFAEKLHSLTNSEIFTTGTVRYSYVGTDDKKYVDKVLKLLSPDNIPRSSWYLVAVHDHKNPRSKALNCGYIVYKDNKLVIFYTNNLQGTPSRYILKGENVEAVKLVHGLGEILRYDKSKYTVNKKVYLVPNIIVAYNLYMNNVDLVDQRRKATYTQRKERKIYMSFFHLILDYAVNNAYALYKWALDHSNGTNDIRVYKDLGTFKKEIGMQLCIPNMKKPRTSPYVGLTTDLTQTYDHNRKRGPLGTDITCAPKKICRTVIQKHVRSFDTMHLIGQFKLPTRGNVKG